MDSPWCPRRCHVIIHLCYDLRRTIARADLVTVLSNPYRTGHHGLANRVYQISIQQCPTSSSYFGNSPWVLLVSFPWIPRNLAAVDISSAHPRLLPRSFPRLLRANDGPPQPRDGTPQTPHPRIQFASTLFEVPQYIPKPTSTTAELESRLHHACATPCTSSLARHTQTQGPQRKSVPRGPDTFMLVPPLRLCIEIQFRLIFFPLLIPFSPPLDPT